MERDIILISESDMAKVCLVQTEALKGIYPSIIFHGSKRDPLFPYSLTSPGKVEEWSEGEPWEKSPQLGACLWMCFWICILLLWERGTP